MKFSRNDPCACKSGKKYKKCCMRMNKTNGPPLDMLEECTEVAFEKKKFEEELEALRQYLLYLEEQDECDESEEKFAQLSQKYAPPPLPEEPEDDELPKRGQAWLADHEDLFDDIWDGRLLEAWLTLADVEPHLIYFVDIDFTLFDKFDSGVYSRVRLDQICDFLQKLSEKAPEYYLLNFGDFDPYLILQAVLDGDQEKALATASRFKVYGGLVAYDLDHVLRMFLYANMEDAFKQVFKASILSVYAVDGPFLSEFAYHHQVAIAQEEAYLTREDAQERAAFTVQSIEESPFGEYLGINEKMLFTTFESMNMSFALPLPGTLEDLDDYYEATLKICGCFQGWMLREKGLPYVLAHDYSILLNGYFHSMAGDEGPITELPMMEKGFLDDYFVDLPGDLDDLQTCSLLHSIYYFVTFLYEQNHFDQQQMQEIHNYLNDVHRTLQSQNNKLSLLFKHFPRQPVPLDTL